MADFTRRAAEILAAQGEHVTAAWGWQANVGGPMSQYECGASWIDFSPDLIRNLEAAWGANQQTISYEFQNTQYEIDLPAGIQTNKTSGKVRPIRRVFVSYPYPPAQIPERMPLERRGRGGPRSTSRAPQRW